MALNPLETNVGVPTKGPFYLPGPLQLLGNWAMSEDPKPNYHFAFCNRKFFLAVSWKADVLSREGSCPVLALGGCPFPSSL
jgi:hypothetical protein